MLQNKYTEIVRFNNTDANTKKTTVFLEVVLAVVVLIIIFIIVNLKKSIISSQISNLTTFVIYLGILFITCLLFHEIVHFFPLWLFSKKRPQFGFFYVILRPNAYISKNKALLCYLLPFLVITLLFFSLSFFLNQILQVALIVMVLVHIPMCSHDFLFSFRLYKCQGANISLAHEKPKKGIDTIFFSV